MVPGVDISTKQRQLACEVSALKSLLCFCLGLVSTGVALGMVRKLLSKCGCAVAEVVWGKTEQ